MLTGEIKGQIDRIWHPAHVRRRALERALPRSSSA